MNALFHHSLWVMLAATGLSVAPTANTGERHVAYVSLHDDNTIAVYDMDAATGELTHKQNVDVGGRVGALDFSPDKRFLYAAVRSRQEVATLAVDPENGTLNLLDSSPIAGDSPYIATDATGRFLFAAYYGAGKISVHPVTDDGRVSPETLQVIETDLTAHAIYPDRSNRFVFVPHTGPSAIHQFLFDERTGTLTPNDPPVVSVPDGAGPRHYRYHPALDIVYFVNELDSTITCFHLNPENGTLEAFQNLSMLPEGFTEENTGAEIQITPDARFLYASNRGLNSLAAFKVDATSGALTFIEHFPTEPVPRSFNIDSTGRFLYSAGQESGKLAAYQIDPDTGHLSRFATYEVGAAPLWVSFFETRD